MNEKEEVICANCEETEFEKVLLVLSTYTFPADNITMNPEACKDVEKSSASYARCTECGVWYVIKDDGTINTEAFVEFDQMLDELGLEEE